MLLAVADSINGAQIRLTHERWEHIVDLHPYMSSYLEAMLAAVEEPEYILPGHGGVLVAVVALGKKSYLHVIYREVSEADGFIITAYIKSKFDKRRAIWRRED